MVIITRSNIRIKGKRKVIEFDDPSLIGLQEILNTILNHVENLDYYLEKINYLLNNWTNIDEIVDSKYGGYWDGYTLMLNKATGRWFSLFYFVDGSSVYIDVDRQKLYVEHEYFPTTLPLELTLLEFKELLEQWRDIQAKKITFKDRIFSLLRLTQAL